MAFKWTCTNLTELDLRLQRDPSVNAEDQGSLSGQSLSKSEVLGHWLTHGRGDHPEAVRLASVATRSVSWLGAALFLFSFVAGISTATALLRVEPARLINISAYLGVLVGLQLLLLAGLGFSAILFRQRISGLQKMLLPSAVKHLPSPLSLSAWSRKIFLTFQFAGIAFNSGALLFTLWKGITFDLAFGWATTINTTGESVHRIVKLLSVPWGGAFAPDLDQILRSRIMVNQDWGTIGQTAAAAWWPFLMMCVLFYGFLPRILLAGWGVLNLNRSLKHPGLSTPECEQIFLALTRKPLTFSGSVPGTPAADASRTPLTAFTPEHPLKLVADEVILPPDRRELFSKKLKSGYQLQIDSEASGQLRLLELWQPPLEETLRSLREFREQAGKNAELLILGVGFPAANPDDFFLPPEEKDLQIWQKRLSELKDPRLGILAWRRD